MENPDTTAIISSSPNFMYYHFDRQTSSISSSKLLNNNYSAMAPKKYGSWLWKWKVTKNIHCFWIVDGPSKWLKSLRIFIAFEKSMDQAKATKGGKECNLFYKKKRGVLQGKKDYQISSNRLIDNQKRERDLKKLNNTAKLSNLYKKMETPRKQTEQSIRGN